MITINLGVFSNRESAEDAIERLEAAGYDTKQISIVVRDTVIGQQLEEATGASVAEGAASGAVTGGAIGVLAGLLVGVGAITIPGIGGVLIGGPLAAALGLTGAAATAASGGVTGALAGGILGALLGLGLPEDVAREYEQEIQAGGVLLAVPAGDADRSRQIMIDCGAEKVRSLTVDTYGQL